MSEQEGYFTKTLKDFGDSIEALRGKVRAFRTRIALSADHVKKIEDAITGLNALIGVEVVKAQDSNEVRLDDHASDEVLTRITALFENRVGEPMSADELTAAREEAQRRGTDHAPPGYKDKDKADPAGDYLVWKQLMLKAKDRKLPIVLITDDRKEDWYQEFKGRTLGARRELREEMMAEAGVPLLIMTTETFLLQAGKYLNVEVSPGTVDQAKELVDLSQVVDFSRPWHTRQRAGNILEAKSIFDILFDRQIAERIPRSSPAKRETLARLFVTATEKGSPEDDQAGREAFTELVRLLPMGSESELDTTAKYIADFLVSDQTTKEEATLALAWLAAWLGQRMDSPGEPPTEG